jgi:hypothetical protein
MPGKSIKDFKLKSLPSVIITFGAAVLSAIAGLFALLKMAQPPSVPSPAKSLDPFVTAPDRTQPIEDKQLAIAPSPVTNPSTTKLPGVAQGNTGGSEKAIALRQGVLRISNPTEHPVRVAILLKKLGSLESSSQSNYEAPAHWDFDPGEGSTKGLLLSLPNRRIKLKKGDILVAFAQDGSRRYWGPYVIGETPEPGWFAKETEWQLTLN